MGKASAVGSRRAGRLSRSIGQLGGLARRDPENLAENSEGPGEAAEEGGSGRARVEVGSIFVPVMTIRKCFMHSEETLLERLQSAMQHESKQDVNRNRFAFPFNAYHC